MFQIGIELGAKEVRRCLSDRCLVKLRFKEYVRECFQGSSQLRKSLQKSTGGPADPRLLNLPKNLEINLPMFYSRLRILLCLWDMPPSEVKSSGGEDDDDDDDEKGNNN